MLAKADSELAAAHDTVQSRRQSDQVAGYFAAVLFLPLLATAPEQPEGAQLVRIYQARDRILLIGAAKHCPLV